MMSDRMRVCVQHGERTILALPRRPGGGATTETGDRYEVRLQIVDRAQGIKCPFTSVVIAITTDVKGHNNYWHFLYKANAPEELSRFAEILENQPYFARCKQPAELMVSHRIQLSNEL